MNTSAHIALKEKQITQLLKLEELFHSHYLTDELLNEMISLYVRFAETIPHNQHAFRLYFRQKIRFVLSRPQVIKSLDNEAVKQGKMTSNNNERASRNEIEEMEMKKLTEQAKAEALNNLSAHPNRKKGQTAELMEKQKNMKIEMQLKIMKEVEDNMNILRNDLKNENKKNEEKIHRLVNEQDDVLNERRANRKKKLRKKSADLKELQVVLVETPPLIDIEQLKMVHKEMHQTYERFTRLTQNKIALNSNKKPNKGRVRFQVEPQPYEQDQFFDQLNQQVKPQQPKYFPKQTLPQKKEEPKPLALIRQTTTVQYKTFDQTNKGRVTVRNNQYEQIDEQQF